MTNTIEDVDDLLADLNKLKDEKKHVSPPIDLPFPRKKIGRPSKSGHQKPTDKSKDDELVTKQKKVSGFIVGRQRVIDAIAAEVPKVSDIRFEARDVKLDETSLRDLCDLISNEWLDVNLACDKLGLKSGEVIRHRAAGAEPDPDKFSHLVWDRLREAEAEAVRSAQKISLSGDAVRGAQARDFLEKTYVRLRVKHSVNVAYEVTAIASAVDHVIRTWMGKKVSLDMIVEISDTINKLSSDALILTLDEKLLK